MVRPAIALVATLLLGTAACAVNDAPTPPPPTTDPAGTDGSAGPDGSAGSAAPDGSAGPTAYGLAVLATPAEATHLSVTDYDAIRVRLGVPDLTSEELMTDRLEFWRTAEASSVLLMDGLLREENSRYDLTYDFTQDDVDAEVRWSVGGSGGGWLLALRPDLDLDLVQTALDADAPGLAGAELDRATGTVSDGVAAGETWASAPALVALGDVAAESLLVRNGCVPFLDALGVDATVEDQDAVLVEHDVAGLVEVEGSAIAFTGMSATVRLAYPPGTATEVIETDLAARLALGEDWPTTESIGFADGFGRGSVTGVDGSVGELQYAVTNPGAAANLALADLVPLGVCTDVELLAEPTGL